MHRFLLTISLLLTGWKVNAQSDSDLIMGVWLNHEKNAKIEIVQSGNTFSGKIVWIKTPTTTPDGQAIPETHQPTAKSKMNAYLGKEILTDLTYNNGKWVNGRLYSPKDDKTVDCTMVVSKDGQDLYLKLSYGILFSKTVAWTKADNE